MRDRSRQILNELPERQARSRLEPYHEVIFEMRRRKYSYREISRLLADRCGLRMSHSAIHDFVRVRLRRTEGATAPNLCERQVQRPPSVRSPAREDRVTDAQSEDVRERIAAAKRRPAAVKDGASEFEFDPTQPLRFGEES